MRRHCATLRSWRRSLSFFQLLTMDTRCFFITFTTRASTRVTLRIAKKEFIPNKLHKLGNFLFNSCIFISRGNIDGIWIEIIKFYFLFMLLANLRRQNFYRLPPYSRCFFFFERPLCNSINHEACIKKV